MEKRCDKRKERESEKDKRQNNNRSVGLRREKKGDTLEKGRQESKVRR